MVAYDAGNGAYAARAWWLFRWLGHAAVAVLNGGFAAWQAERLSAAQRRRTSDRAPRFRSALPLTRVVSVAEVLDRGASMDLVDARAEARFRGEVEPIDPVAGHIPGARCAAVRRQPRSRRPLRRARSAAPSIRGRSASADRDLVCYCGSGVTACHNILAMRYAGLPEATLYAGFVQRMDPRSGATGRAVTEPIARPGAPIIPARLSWQGDQPFSRQFGDIYHAPDGIAEVERVFVEPQRLSERFATRAPRLHDRRDSASAPRSISRSSHNAISSARRTTRRLHFITVEKHPIAPREFATLAQRRCASVADLPASSRARIRHCWRVGIGVTSPPVASRCRCSSATLRADSPTSSIDSVCPIDAWLLDGFAPDRNPQLWRESLWRTLAQLSADGTTVATFSAVGAVRRALADAGFAMRKIDQRPHKRHTLRRRVRAGAPHRHTHRLASRGHRRRRSRRRRYRTTTRRSGHGGDALRHRADATEPHGGHAVSSATAAGRQHRQRGCAASAYLYSAHWYDASHARSRPGGALQFPRSEHARTARLELAADAFAPTGDWVVRGRSAPRRLRSPVCRCANMRCSFRTRARSISARSATR